jgi:hypothetical protein
MISYFEKLMKTIKCYNAIYQNIDQLENIYRIL